MNDSISLPLRMGPQLSRGPEAAVLRQEFQKLEVNSAITSAQAVELQAAAANASAQSNNRRIFEVLKIATGQQLGDQPQAWWDWWQDYNQKWWPQVSQFTYNQQQRFYPAAQVRHSCFVAGTLIHTQTGLLPIELIKPGDRVLAQDQDTGDLNFKLVSATTVRPPAPILRIEIKDHPIETTLGHPFWVDGRGWKMAKELKEGDLLHSLNGAVRVDKIEQAGEEKAYNLVVDDFNTYFAGQQGLLVHDNEFRKPTRSIVPGLTADDGEAAFVKK